MPYLSFLSDTDFARCVGNVIHAIHRTQEEDFDLSRNVLDPFAAVFQCAALGTDLEGWERFERQRQSVKAAQNAIGSFHQELVGCLPGWQSLPTGEGLDVIHVGDALCAEIKNKYNTTKGNHRPRVYDDMQKARALHEQEYGKVYTAYLVTLVQRSPGDHDRPFTPSDGGFDRPEDPRVREVSGALFWDRITGVEGALRQLYAAIPMVLDDVFDLQIRLSHDQMESLFDAGIREPQI